MIEQIIQGYTPDALRELESESVQCIVTSPPYYGLRDYGTDPITWGDGWIGELGQEPTPAQYVAHIAEVFRECRRVLKRDGVLWLNLGDSMQKKNLIGIPWRVAFALQDDGWILRRDIIWHKPNAMPESVKDRPSESHEYVFLFSKSVRYFYSADAIREAFSATSHGGALSSGGNKARNTQGGGISKSLGLAGADTDQQTRNARSVWSIATEPFSGSHYAVMPVALADRCVRAGSRASDTILDPFGGRGTVGLVAKASGRNYVLVEPNAANCAMARQFINSGGVYKSTRKEDAPTLWGDAA